MADKQEEQRIHIVIDMQEGDISGVFSQRKHAEMLERQWNEGRAEPLYWYVGSFTLDALVPHVEENS
jgi:hypothetical protein